MMRLHPQNFCHKYSLWPCHTKETLTLSEASGLGEAIPSDPELAVEVLSGSQQ